ncbi:hypothetical protein [Nocardia abscessus]|uniref:hypothetical protein n=1 Tax=Nocardia abscessus TaxID=120957 RepID=UPI002454B699|nr:hypothetical protein [Nocardia abscessus]
MPKRNALIFINRGAPSLTRTHALDLRRALDLADDLRLNVPRCYVAGPLRPDALQHMMFDARRREVGIVITPRAETVRLDIIRRQCDVIVVDTGIVYRRWMAFREPISAPRRREVRA